MSIATEDLYVVIVEAKLYKEYIVGNLYIYVKNLTPLNIEKRK